MSNFQRNGKGGLQPREKRSVFQSQLQRFDQVTAAVSKDNGAHLLNVAFQPLPGTFFAVEDQLLGITKPLIAVNLQLVLETWGQEASVIR